MGLPFLEDVGVCDHSLSNVRKNGMGQRLRLLSLDLTNSVLNLTQRRTDGSIELIRRAQTLDDYFATLKYEGSLMK